MGKKADTPTTQPTRERTPDYTQLFVEGRNKIYEVHTWAGAQQLGKGTVWCTAKKSMTDYPRLYSAEKGRLFVLYRGPRSKYRNAWVQIFLGHGPNGKRQSLLNDNSYISREEILLEVPAFAATIDAIWPFIEPQPVKLETPATTRITRPPRIEPMQGEFAPMLDHTPLTPNDAGLRLAQMIQLNPELAAHLRPEVEIDADWSATRMATVAAELARQNRARDHELLEAYASVIEDNPDRFRAHHDVLARLQHAMREQMVGMMTSGDALTELSRTVGSRGYNHRQHGPQAVVVRKARNQHNRTTEYVISAHRATLPGVQGSEEVYMSASLDDDPLLNCRTDREKAELEHRVIGDLAATLAHRLAQASNELVLPALLGSTAGGCGAIDAELCASVGTLGHMTLTLQQLPYQARPIEGEASMLSVERLRDKPLPLALLENGQHMIDNHRHVSIDARIEMPWNVGNRNAINISVDIYPLLRYLLEEVNELRRCVEVHLVRSPEGGERFSINLRQP